MRMKILWQSFVDPDQNAAYFASLRRDLNAIANPGTTIDVIGISPQDRDFGRLAEFRCAIIAVDNAIEAEANGYDAFVMGHFQDPGVYEARSAVRIPVVGAGEATLHYAAQIGRRIALVSIDPVFEVWHLEQAERYGLGDRVQHVAGLGVLPQDFAAAFAGDEAAYARMRDAFVACAEPLVRAGSDVVIAAGVLPGLMIGREKGLTVLHAPIVNCAAVALMTAEMGVRLRALNGLEASRGPSFALAPPRAIADFRALVAGGRT
jgi:allantoin racemase